MQLEDVKLKNSTETGPETKVVTVEENEAEATKAVDRLKEELHIDVEKEQKIKEKQEIEDLREGMGAERNEDQEVAIETNAFIEKLEIPFGDPEVDKKREELLKETESKINPKLKKLEENRQKALDIKKEKEELEKKKQELEVLKAEKEKELEAIRKEAKEYIANTKPPIIRSSTKEKLARAKAIIQYFEKAKAKTGDHLELLSLSPAETKKISEKYSQYVINEFNRIQEKDKDVEKNKKALQYLHDDVTRNNSSIEYGTKDSEDKKSLIEKDLKESEAKLELLKQEQEKVDERKAVEVFVEEILEDLFSETPDSIIELPSQIQEKQKFTKENSKRNIKKSLNSFLNGAILDGLSKEQKLEVLKAEVQKVRESAVITINLQQNSLTGVLEAGRFKSANEIPLTKNKRDQNYLQRRKITEEVMGVYSSGTEEDPHVICGSIASKNGYDENHGGAEYYGEIFVKMNPKALDKSVYFDGDSMGNGHAQENKEKKGDVPSNLYSKEDVFLLKAIKNIRDKEISELSNSDFSPGNGLNDYIEAEILGGVKIEDIESINIPLLRAEHEYQEAEKAFKNLEKLNQPREKEANTALYKYRKYESMKKYVDEIKKKYPEYTHLIKEI